MYSVYVFVFDIDCPRGLQLYFWNVCTCSENHFCESLRERQREEEPTENR